jgi:elongation factor 1-gamma
MHGVYGDEPNLEIRGLWLWRGVEIPLEMKEHPSFEFHKLFKLNVESEADRNVINQYWLNQTEDESVVEGLVARTLVYFK